MPRSQESSGRVTRSSVRLARRLLGSNEESNGSESNSGSVASGSVEIPSGESPESQQPAMREDADPENGSGSSRDGRDESPVVLEESDSEESPETQEPAAVANGDVVEVESDYNYSTDEDEPEGLFEPDENGSSSVRIVPSSTDEFGDGGASPQSSNSSVGTSSTASISLQLNPVLLSSLAQSFQQMGRYRGPFGSPSMINQSGNPNPSMELVSVGSQPTSRPRPAQAVVVEDEDNSNDPGYVEVDLVSEHGSEEEEKEEEEPARKMRKIDTETSNRSMSEDDDGFTCQICYEPFTNSGGHRVSCLKCGHVFGKECIERWIHTSKRCPSCNCKATKKDLRVIYVKNLKATDTAELENVKDQLRQAMIEKNRIELSYQTLKQKDQLRENEIIRLQLEIKTLKARLDDSNNRNGSLAGPSSSSSCLKMGSEASTASSSAPSGPYAGLKMPKLSLLKHFDIKEGQCRVGAFSNWMNLYCVSHSFKSALFPGGSYGIKKINSLEWRVSQSFPIHSKPLRDMAFNSSQHDLLLTVGLDKKAVLFNAASNVTVQTFNTDHALWSCCWNGVNDNIFYVGAANGQVASYDIRSPQQRLGNLFIPTLDRSSVARLKYVPAAYQYQSLNSTGLLVQKLNSVWFCEMTGAHNSQDNRFYQLPIEGPFSNMDFEPTTRQVLVSCRPKQRQGSTHLICDLKKNYSTEVERDMYSCDVVQSITAGFQDSSVLCRSAIFSPKEGQVYVAANGEGYKTVRVWDISNMEQKSLIRISDDVAVDFVHGRLDADRNFLGIITDKSSDVYEVK